MTPGIAVLGGTFDPVHYGHIRSAQAIRRVLSFAEVRLIPSFQPPHRQMPQCSAEHRLAMLRIAVDKLDGIAADDREISRRGPSYTVETLASLRAEVGAVPVAFVMGMDAFGLLSEWYQWRTITELAHIVVLQRPGHPIDLHDEMSRWVAERKSSNINDLRDNKAGCVAFLELAQIPVSSTEIRDVLHRGEVPQDKLPQAVITYIKYHGLYQ